MIDKLESRLLLAADTTLDPTTHVLTITSNTAGEIFTVTSNGTFYTVNVAGDGFTESDFPVTGGSALRGFNIVSNPGGGATRPGDIVQIASNVLIPTTVTGSTGDDTVQAGGGNTTINGGTGADFLIGGAGNDSIDGGAGRAARTPIPEADDTIIGGAGNDFLAGGASPDNSKLGSVILGGAGNDTIQGGDGRDIIDGGSGNNALDYTDKTSGSGVNVVLPNPANDAINNPVAANRYNSANPVSPTNFPYLGFGEVSSSNNRYYVSEGDQVYAGLDALIDTTDPTTLDYNTLVTNNVNNLDLTASTFHTINTGDATDQVDVFGQPGPYNINTAGGVDSIDGSLGNDTISSGASSGSGRGGANNYDIVLGEAGNDLITAVSGFQDLNGDSTFDNTIAGNDTIIGGTGDDIIHGDNGNDSLDGGAGSDLITGGTGDTTLADGDDTMLGGTGAVGDNDTLEGDGGSGDIADYSARSVALNISLNDVADDGSPGENDDVTETTEIVLGGSGADQLTGGAFTHTLRGNGGNDTLTAGSGSTAFYGGAGKDTLSYANRNTGVSVTLDGVANDGSGTDFVNNDIEVLIGGAGNDVLNGNNVAYAMTIQGNAGNDSLYGGSLADTLVGGVGNDQLHGNAGTDTLDGGVGNDSLFGDDGNDILLDSAGGDLYDGGNGVDQLDMSARTVNLTITMDGNANDGAAGEGDNVLNTVEKLYTGRGNDRITADAASVAAYTLYGNAGNDTISGSGGVDLIDGGAGTDSLSGNGGNDAIYGQAGKDTLRGGDGNDRLLGGTENDSIAGDGGDDTLLSGSGKDTVRGGDGNDLVSYYYESRPVSLSLDGFSNDGYGGEKDFIAADVEGLEGGSGPDKLFGNSAANTLLGDGGNDSIYAGDGADSLNGGTGADYLDGQAGNDTIDGGTGGDAIIGGAGTDTVTYASRTVGVNVSIDNRINDGAVGEFDSVSSTIEVILGGSGNDTIAGGGAIAMTINGGAGNDSIVTGRLNDSVIGGAGNDTISTGAGDDTIDAADGAADTLDGGLGNNVINSDPGLDVV